SDQRSKTRVCRGIRRSRLSRKAKPDGSCNAPRGQGMPHVTGPSCPVPCASRNSTSWFLVAAFMPSFSGSVWVQMLLVLLLVLLRLEFRDGKANLLHASWQRQGTVPTKE